MQDGLGSLGEESGPRSMNGLSSDHSGFLCNYATRYSLEEHCSILTDSHGAILLDSLQLRRYSCGKKEKKKKSVVEAAILKVACEITGKIAPGKSGFSRCLRTYKL